jgi:hypothetical protein
MFWDCRFEACHNCDRSSVHSCCASNVGQTAAVAKAQAHSRHAQHHLHDTVPLICCHKLKTFKQSTTHNTTKHHVQQQQRSITPLVTDSSSQQPGVAHYHAHYHVPSRLETGMDLLSLLSSAVLPSCRNVYCCVQACCSQHPQLLSLYSNTYDQVCCLMPRGMMVMKICCCCVQTHCPSVHRS